MSDNTEPSTSRRMTVIREEARCANKALRSLSQEDEEAQANYEQDDRVKDAETTDGASSGDREDATTTDGADHTDGGIGGSQTAKKTRSKKRIGHRKCSATSQTRSPWYRQVAYQCSRRFLPEGTTCN